MVKQKTCLDLDFKELPMIVRETNKAPMIRGRNDAAFRSWNVLDHILNVPMSTKCDPGLISKE